MKKNLDRNNTEEDKLEKSSDYQEHDINPFKNFFL